MKDAKQTLRDMIETAEAEDLHVKLAAIDITEIPVKTLDRCIPRKEQAKMARELFKSLGLKGISVTTPNYSMAQTVEVRLPRRRDYVLDDSGFICRQLCEASKANHEAESRVESILLAAFPQHDDRSDIQTDYFDRCWSLRG